MDNGFRDTLFFLGVESVIGMHGNQQVVDIHRNQVDEVRRNQQVGGSVYPRGCFGHWVHVMVREHA